VLAADAVSPRCAELANSPLPEPDWYLTECLGGIPPITATRIAGPWRVPGDLFYLHNVRAAGQFPNSVYTSPIPTYTFTLLGANANLNFATDFDNGATTFYGINNTTRELGTYDLTTGAWTSLGATTGLPPAPATISGLKFDPTSTTVYVTATDGTVSNLFTLDLQTRVATLVGPITGFPLIIDIAISNSGQMYGHDIGVDQLVAINKATGAATAIGATGVNANFAQGMDFDASDNTLYAFIYIGGGVNDLRRFDLTTGAATLILNGPAGPEMEGAVKVAAVRATPVALKVDDAGNKVMEPGETATVAPSWRNDSSLTLSSVTGTLSNFTGPAGPTYSIVDANASYGNIAAGATAQCTDCYSVMASGTRPQQHWDSTVTETLSVAGQSKDWTLHIGDSFSDVPNTGGFYRFIETLFHKSVTGGCGTGIYCPSNITTREQMSAFVLVSKEGAGYNPPACVPPNLFSDVPETSPFCKFIEELANRGVVTGCGPNLYCPTNNVTREQMAVFVLRTLDPALNPPACVAGSEMFNDVPSTSPFCKWIEELARRAVVTGCGGGAYCPLDPVTREQMGVFISVTFGLQLYGV
jgi:hypothetical protein